MRRQERNMTSPTIRAMWLIESRLETGLELELSQIADYAGVSPHHLVRAFSSCTGVSVMRYVRRRRLSNAAKRLCQTAASDRDILAIAIDAGYGSHEAFTRAFRAQFGVTPESVRAHRCIKNLDLQEAFKMSDDLIIDLEPPRIKTRDALSIAGLSDRYTFETNTAIPALWERFLPYIGHIPGQIDGNTYGVCYNGDGNGAFDYLCGVAIFSMTDLPPEFKTIKLHSGRYAVFRHNGHISGIRATWYTIWNKWLPQSGYSVASAPDFECYSSDFDPETGTGSVEIWIPLAP